MKNNTMKALQALYRSRQVIGRSALVCVAVGYTGFFAVTLMKPQAFNAARDTKMKATDPTFVATTPATARLPEMPAQTDATVLAPVTQSETTAAAEGQSTVAATTPQIVTTGEAQPFQATKSQAEIGLPSAKKFMKKRSDSINDDLGMDILQAADETIADASNMRRDMSESVLKSLGISKRQYATIKMRERRLAQKLRDADDRGTDGFKRLLKTDHTDWMKEYLGPVRYQRFMELAGNS